MGLFGDLDAEAIDDIPDDPWKVPVGEQVLTVQDAVKRQGKNGGAWGIQIKWGNGDGQSLTTWTNLPLTGDPAKDKKARIWLKRLFVDLGIPRDRWDNIDANEDGVIEEFLGIEARGIVEDGEPNAQGYRNQKFNNITRIGAAPKSEPTTLSGLSEFADEPEYQF